MVELWWRDQIIDHENPINILDGHSRNVNNPNITLTKGQVIEIEWS